MTLASKRLAENDVKIHDIKTVISRQHFSKADSAVKTRQAAFGDKGTQLEIRCKKGKIHLFIDFMTGSFALKILENVHIVQNSMYT